MTTQPKPHFNKEHYLLFLGVYACTRVSASFPAILEYLQISWLPLLLSVLLSHNFGLKKLPAITLGLFLGFLATLGPAFFLETVTRTLFILVPTVFAHLGLQMTKHFQKT